MVDKDDWRRTGQEEYMMGVMLIHASFSREIRDHDHCEFCWATFSEHPDHLHQGYCTEDMYRWICPECYEDFREEFGWVLKDEE